MRPLIALTDPSSKAAAPFWERAYVVLTFFTACRGFDTMFSNLSSGGGQLSDSSPARFAWLTFLYAISLFLIVRDHRHDIPRLIFENKLLVFVVIYILASSAWAFDPATSFRRSSAFALTVVFCFYVATRYRLVDLLSLAGWAITLVAVVSVIAIIVAPEFAVEQWGRKTGSWRGICGINTAFARFMAVGVLVIWCLRRAAWGLQRFDVLVFGLVAFAAIQAHAATTYIALLAGFLSILVLWSRSVFDLPISIRFTILSLLGLVVVLLIPTFWEEILGLLGRDKTLTHRLYFWQAAIERGWDNPYFGVGYQSFWIEGNAAGVFYNMFGSAGTIMGNGHNGYLDVWLELGVFGLMLTLLLFVQAAARVLRCLSRSDDIFGEFYGGLIIFILVYSIAEKVILVHSELTWMLFMSGLVGLRIQDGDSSRIGNASMPGVLDVGTRGVNALSRFARGPNPGR